MWWFSWVTENAWVFKTLLRGLCVNINGTRIGRRKTPIRPSDCPPAPGAGTS